MTYFIIGIGNLKYVCFSINLVIYKYVTWEEYTGI